MKPRDIIALCSLLLTTLFVACSTDMDISVSDGMGRLQLAMPNVSAATRAVPAELGVPTSGDFTLSIINSTGRAVYQGTFTEEEMSLPVGEYTIRATYGTNPQLGLDTPYYIAEQTATLVENQTTQVALKAKVANALVSAVFGRDAEEQARFDRFYSDYALYVHIGSYSIPIRKAFPEQSVYVQAGSQVSLSFWGKLRLENDREVQMTLEATSFPSPIAAADHAIVTLSLPDPESALTVDISKVTLETETLDETIPLSWLPVPTVTPTHHYNNSGNLVGTNLSFSDSYPGLNWRAVITNAAGTEVRLVQGTGVLTSEYTSSTTWPYLPQGKYKATYYLISGEGSAKIISSREFLVGAPSISVNVNGYTSYDKYLAGDIEAANACDRLTIYEPSVKFNVDRSLLKNSNYSYSFTYTYDGGTATTVTAGLNSYFIGNITEQTVRREPHVLRAEASFDGVNAISQKDLLITGLPYSLDLSNHDEWEGSGGVDWFENDVRLGHLSTGSQYIQTTTSICLPPSTSFCADYNVNVHTLTVGTYFSIKAGDNEILKIEEEGTPFRDTDHLHEGTTDVCYDDNEYITRIRCYNDYGAGQTCSHIYSLKFKYASH